LRHINADVVVVFGMVINEMDLSWAGDFMVH